MVSSSRCGASDGAAASAPVIYLDNAATSWPKPPEVIDAVTHYLRDVGANPGRAGHARAADAGRLVLDARLAVARLVGARDPMRVLFGPNATWGLNLAIQGLLHPGDHVVTTSLEHNSVLRPLRWLERERGIAVTIVPASPAGQVEAQRLADAISDHTALVVVCQASNVCGAVQDIASMGAACRARGVPLLVDAAQSAGVVDLDLDRDGIDLLAFAGHKGLLGPTGTGGLVLADGFDGGRLRPLVCGGTGSRSDSTEQPDALPDRFESGTLNVAGLAGLAAGLQWLQDQGGPTIVGRHEAALRRRFITRAAADVPGFDWSGPEDRAVGVVSFNVAGLTPSHLGDQLSERFGILGRQGLHCAPEAHRTLGTFPTGSLRFGFGPFNTEADVDAAVVALAQLAVEAGS
jgi:cysteine desulfurase / selenocysteine lyase